MKGNETYRIELEEGRVILRTSSFKAEKGSVLHSGIFSRELASSFVAVVAAVLLLIFFAVRYELGLLHYIAAALVLVVVFPLCRIYLFREPYLETVFDKTSGTVSMTLRRPILSRGLSMPIGSVRDIKVEHVRIEPDNPDAVAFVERIALQHGTVIPGFGEVQDFYNVLLVHDSGSYTILTTRTESEAADVVEKLKRYIGVEGPKREDGGRDGRSSR